MDTDCLPHLPPRGHNVSKRRLLTKYEQAMISGARAENQTRQTGASGRERVDHTDSIFDIISIEDYLRNQVSHQETLYHKLLLERKQSTHILREKIMRERYPLTGPLATPNEGEERPRSSVFTPIHKFHMPKICPKFLRRNGGGNNLAHMEDPKRTYSPVRPRSQSSSPFGRRKFGGV